MGKGYNNYMCKKPFHPGSKANIKRSWMAEQRTENEKKKQDELRIQYEKEQDLYNNKALLSNESKDKLALNFMYEAPPGAKRERQKEDDEPEYKFDWQRKYNAPREDFAKDNKDIKDQPFGIPVRNVRCIKCHNWGHINTDKECPLYNQAHSSSMPTTSMDPLELMQQMREDGLSLKQNILGHQLDMNQSNQQFLTSDEEDPEMEFLKSLTTKQKKKLLRKLNKLSKKEGKKEIKPKKKKKKQKKLKEKKDSKKLKQKTKKVKVRKHASSSSNSNSSNSSNSGSDSETTTSDKRKSNPKSSTSQARSSSSSYSESEGEIVTDKQQKSNAVKSRTENQNEAYTNSVTHKQSNYQFEENNFREYHSKGDRGSNSTRDNQRSKTDEKSNYWKTQKDSSYNRRTDYEHSFQRRGRYDDSYEDRERRIGENYRYNNRRNSRSPEFNRWENYSDYPDRDRLRYDHHSHQRDDDGVRSESYRNERSYRDNRGRNLPSTGQRNGYGRERMDNNRNHRSYRSDYNRDDRSPLRDYSDRRRRSRSPYLRK